MFGTKSVQIGPKPTMLHSGPYVLVILNEKEEVILSLIYFLTLLTAV